MGSATDPVGRANHVDPPCIGSQPPEAGIIDGLTDISPLQLSLSVATPCSGRGTLMFGSWGNQDDDVEIGEIYDRLQSGTKRTSERSCDRCDASEGSVIVVRQTDLALCTDCFNDPDCWELPEGDFDG